MEAGRRPAATWTGRVAAWRASLSSFRRSGSRAPPRLLRLLRLLQLSLLLQLALLMCAAAIAAAVVHVRASRASSCKFAQVRASSSLERLPRASTITAAATTTAAGVITAASVPLVRCCDCCSSCAGPPRRLGDDRVHRRRSQPQWTLYRAPLLHGTGVLLPGARACRALAGAAPACRRDYCGCRDYCSWRCCCRWRWSCALMRLLQQLRGTTAPVRR